MTYPLTNYVWKIVILFQVACTQGLTREESSSAERVVDTTTLNGVTTGESRALTKTSQTMAGSEASGLSDVTVTFPPGSLAVDMAVSLEPVTANVPSSDVNFLNEIGLTNEQGSIEPGLAIAVGNDAKVNPTSSLLIQLPLENTLGLLNAPPILSCRDFLSIPRQGTGSVFLWCDPEHLS